MTVTDLDDTLGVDAPPRRLDAAAAPTAPAGDDTFGGWRAPTGLLVGPLIALTACSWVGLALVPVLAPSHPLWLVALNSGFPVLIVASAHVTAWQVIALASVRSCLADPFTYMLGRRFGPKVSSTLSRRFRPAAWLSARLERFMHRRAAVPLVALWGDSRVVASAGAGGMPPGRFAMSTVVGAVVTSGVAVLAAGSIPSLALAAMHQRAAVASAAAIAVIAALVGRRR